MNIALDAAKPLPRTPITGIAGCCARAASGHAAAALAISVMNSRRFTLNIGGVLPPWRRRSVYRTLNLPHDGRQVLGTDLNCSESRGWPALKVPPARPG